MVSLRPKYLGCQYFEAFVKSLRLSTHLWVIWCTNCQFRALRVVKLLPKISHETRIPVGDNCAGNSMKMNDLRNKCRRNCITRKITWESNEATILPQTIDHNHDNSFTLRWWQLVNEIHGNVLKKKIRIGRVWSKPAGQRKESLIYWQTWHWDESLNVAAYSFPKEIWGRLMKGTSNTSMADDGRRVEFL